MSKSKFAIEVKDIVKEFSSVRVLDQISIGIKPGEIMGLIGENGAGKSTLIKIICGIYQATSGEIYLEDAPCQIKDYVSAKNLGIAIVPQEFNLINHLTVYENIFLGNEIHKGVFLDKNKMREKASRQMAALNMNVDVNQLISELSVAEKQMVEVSKALMLDAKILIFDEPTTTLTSKEVKILFELMNSLKAKGVTMVFVSHKLNEIKSICDRVTILRDGKLIAIEKIEEVNEEQIARHMIGREFNKVFPPKLERKDKNSILKVEDLSIKNLLTNINFELRHGEILGFAGLVGSGRTETMEALMGLRRKDSGTIWIKGKQVNINNPNDAIFNKLGYISEDRQGKGIVQIFDIPQNMSLISMHKYRKGPFIDKKKEDLKAEDYIDKFNIVAASKKMELKYFSGGNQQKVYLSRWMDTDPEILILDEPTRGIDVNAKREIYEFIHSLAKSGISCILISSEMEEIIGLCSRVYVMKEGQISNCLSGPDINEEEIMFNATGLKGKK